MAHDMVLKTVTPESVGVPSEGVEAFVKTVKDMKLREHSILVLRHGKIIAEGYAPQFGEDQLHRMYSVSKTFVAAAIGRLIFEGRLTLKDKIIKFFPDQVKGPVEPQVEAMTIRDLLIMSTPYAETTYNFSKEICSDWVGSFFKAKAVKDPGAIFKYDTSGTFILNVIVERITGIPLLEYLKQTIFKKIGFSQDAWCVKSPENYSWVGSGVLCTTRDLAKLAILFANGGWYDGEQVLPEDFVKEATSRQIDNNFRGRAENCIEGYGYGYKVWMTWRGGYAFFGMGDQFAVTVPDKDLILVVTADNQGDPNAAPVLLRAFWENIVDRTVDGVLPENPAAYESMKNEVSYLPLPIIDGMAHAFIENEINGKVFKATRKNDTGITEFSFHFSGDMGEFRYTNARGKKVIKFGLGKFVEGTFPEIYAGENIQEPCDHEYRCAACAVFQDDHTLSLRVDVIDWYFGNLTATFGFKDGECGYRMVKNAENFMNDYWGWGEGQMVKE